MHFNILNGSSNNQQRYGVIIIMDQDPLRNALICETLYDKEVPTSSLQTLA